MKQYTQYIDDISGLEQVEDTVVLIQKVAAKNIAAAKTRLVDTTEYERKLERVITDVLPFAPGFSHPFLPHATHNNAVIILGSDNGIVGSLWYRMVEYAIAQAKYQHVLALGKKVADHCRENHLVVDASFVSSFAAETTIEDIWKAAALGYSAGTYTGIDVVFAHASSIAQQTISHLQLLPLEETFTDGVPVGMPIFEGSKGAFLSALFTRYARVRLARLFWETRLSEYSARTLTSEYAQQKTRKLIKKTKQEFVTTRRKLMTMKQLETYSNHTN